MQAIPVPTFERHNTCLSCGYDLFGQPRVGVCPECGASTRESARNEQFLGSPENVALLQSGAGLLLWSSVLAGLCPGVCFWFVATDSPLALAITISAVFFATAVTAAVGERRLAWMSDAAASGEASGGTVAGERRGPHPHLIADILAGVGLLVVNLAAYIEPLQVAVPRSSREATAGVMIAVGFGLLAGTSWRATPAYRMRANIADACLGLGHRGFVVLGIAKSIYETLWLGCCSVAALCFVIGAEDFGIFLAFGALFGLGGYGILWVFMIVVHAVFFARMRRRLGEPTRGFEVVAVQPQGA